MSQSFDEILDEDEVVETETAGAATTETVAVDVSEPAPVAETAAPEVAAEAPAEATPQVTLPEGYKLDALGRVHGPDGRVVSKEEAEKLKAQASEAQPAPEPLAPPPVTPETPKIEEPVKPFEYRSGGQTHAIEGLKVDGTPEAVGKLRQVLNWAHWAPQLQSENAQLRKQVETVGENETRARALVESLTPLLTEQDEAKALEEFFRLRGEFPNKLREAEVNYWKQRAMGGQAPEPQRAASNLPDEGVAREVTTAHIEDLKFVHDFRHLSADDWKQYAELATVNPYAFIRPATAEHAKQYGVRQGEPVFDTDALATHLKAFAQRISAAREAEAQAKKAREAAAFNAANKPITTAPQPAKPRPKPVAATATTPSGQRPGWDQQFKRAWDDEDDE